MDGTEEMDQPAQGNYGILSAQPYQEPVETQNAPQSAATIPQQSTEAAPTPAVQVPPQPPARRAGIAGILDAVGDMLAGSRHPDQISRADDGSRQVTPGAPMSRGQQWAKVGLEAVQGATTAMAAGHGQGNGPIGVAAAVQQQLGQQQQAAQKAEDESDKDFQTKQAARLNQINYQLLSRKLVAQTITDHQNEIQGTQEQVDFSKKQIADEQANGSINLGFVKSAGDIASLGAKDPDFIKNYHDGLIVPHPVLGDDGKVLGLQVFQRNVSENDKPFTGQIHQFVPPQNPGDQPTYATYTPVNMTKGQATNANMQAYTQFTAYQQAQQKAAEDKAKVGLTNAQAAEAQAGVPLKHAQAAEAYASANEHNATAAASRNPSSGSGETDVLADTAEGLATGRYTQGMIPKRTGKGQPTPQQQFAAANDYSMKHFGLPYNPAIIDQENRFAGDKKVTAVLDGIDRMVGTPGQQGQLDQLLGLAQKAGLGANAPLNAAGQFIKRKLGNDAAKQYETLLTDTQSNLGTLIGNPLIGSGESDLKLRTAQKAFGSDATLQNMQGQAQVAKDVLLRARGQMASKNRFIQQRYGEAHSPTLPQTAPPPPAGATAAIKNAQGVVTAYIVNGQRVAAGSQ